MKSRLTCVGVSSGGSGASTSGGWTTTVNRGAAGESPILTARTVTIQIRPTPRWFSVSTALTCSGRASSRIQMARCACRCER